MIADSSPLVASPRCKVDFEFREFETLAKNGTHRNGTRYLHAGHACEISGPRFREQGAICYLAEE
jgi:hypothetical protein